ncbi:MAG: anti-sigma factor [Gemmatimonadaceae bacterium]
MTVPPLDCLTVVHLMWDFLDHELPAERLDEVRMHLATCTGCRSHVDFCRSFLERLRAVPVDATEVDVLRGRVREALRVEAARER